MPWTSLPDTLGQGPQGIRGFVGGPGLPYKFETATTEPPSSGRIRFNHATPASATRVYIHDTDRDGVNLDAALDQIQVDDLLLIRSDAHPYKFHIFQVTARVDDGSHHDFTVVYIAGNGTFEDGRALGLSYTHKGNPGGFTTPHNFDDNTGGGPASGYVRLNNATPASATTVYINDTDRVGTDLDTFLDTLKVNDLIKIFSKYTSTYAIYRVTANTDSGSYHTLTVVYVAGTGTFVDEEEVGVGFSIIGDDGADAFVEVDHSVDTTSGDFTTTEDYPDFEATAMIDHDVTVAAGDKIYVWFSGTAGWAPGDDTTAVIVGVSINGGTIYPIATFHTSSLGLALFPCLSGCVVLDAPGTGTYTVAAFLSRNGGSNSMVMAEPEYPLRLSTLVVRP